MGRWTITTIAFHIEGDIRLVRCSAVLYLRGVRARSKPPVAATLRRGLTGRHATVAHRHVTSSAILRRQRRQPLYTISVCTSAGGDEWLL